MCAYACYLLAFHGRSATAYSLPCALFWLTSFLAFVFGVVGHQRADSIPGFVNTHWELLKQIVFPHYARERPNVYAQAAKSVVKEASVASIHLCIHLLVLAGLYTAVAIETVREEKEKYEPSSRCVSA